jgi:hypothetical protein
MVFLENLSRVGGFGGAADSAERRSGRVGGRSTDTYGLSQDP